MIGMGGYDPGFRAAQIQQRLAALKQADEKALLAVQLDAQYRPNAEESSTGSTNPSDVSPRSYYERWRKLALRAIDAPDQLPNKTLLELRTLLTQAETQAHGESKQFLFLQAFSRDTCRRLNVDLENALFESLPVIPISVPPQRWLEVLENNALHLVRVHTQGKEQTCDSLIRSYLIQSIGELAVSTNPQLPNINNQSKGQQSRSLEDINWTNIGRLRINHPLASIPVIGDYLRMRSKSIVAGRHISRTFKVQPSVRRNGSWFHPATKKMRSSICRADSRAIRCHPTFQSATMIG